MIERASNTILSSHLPEIIQGGMGVGVSNWRLARAVAKAGGLGVVSGTALDTVLLRRLQDGDLDGAMRRAMAAFPYPHLVEPILNNWYRPGGRFGDQPYRVKPLPVVDMIRSDEALLIVANFVEVYLAKEGHDGLVGINLLEKIQLPNLPSLFGAMLAGVDAVLMGGGIPLEIPEVLDELAQLRPVKIRLNLEQDRSAAELETQYLSFHPGTYVSATQPLLKRPLFIPVISSEVLAKTLLRKANGRVDGFVVENHNAGGHNAPPRRDGAYGPRDVCRLDQISILGRPFWLAGGSASPKALSAAKALGAVGVQIGTAFALSEESGILAGIKAQMIRGYFRGELDVVTDFQASPTGYPFKRVELPGKRSVKPARVCDLGYLRHVYTKDDGTIAYRCPASPSRQFLRSGGEKSEAEGKQCLCNGLLATVGLGQTRRGRVVQPLVTAGEDFSFLSEILQPEESQYSALDVINYLQG